MRVVHAADEEEDGLGWLGGVTVGMDEEGKLGVGGVSVQCAFHDEPGISHNSRSGGTVLFR